MGTIPPSLPPTFGGHINPLGPTDAQLVNEFKALWDNWYNNPSVQTGTALLNYIESHKTQIVAIADSNPNIMPITRPGGYGIIPIERTFSTAISNLTTWIKEEKAHPPANRTGPSEFIKDLYDWISYAR